MQKPLSVVSTSLSSCRTLSRERSAPRRALTDGYRKTKEKGARRPSFFALSYILRARFFASKNVCKMSHYKKRQRCPFCLAPARCRGQNGGEALSDPLSYAHVIGGESVKMPRPILKQDKGVSPIGATCGSRLPATADSVGIYRD